MKSPVILQRRLLLSGAGVAVLLLIAGLASRERGSSDPDLQSGKHASAKGPRTANASDPRRGRHDLSGESDAARIAQIKSWLRDYSPVPDKEDMLARFDALVSALSFAALREMVEEADRAIPYTNRGDDTGHHGRPRFLHRALWERYTRLDPDAAWELFLSRLKEDDRRAAGTVLTGIARKDPLRVLDALTDPSHGASYGEIEGLEELVKDITASHPDEVFDTVATMVKTESPYSWQSVNGCIAGLAAGSDWPAVSARLAEAFPEASSERSRIAGLVAARWILEDREAGLAWLDGISPEVSYERSIAMVAWLQAEPEKAARWLEEWDMPAGKKQELYNSMIFRGGLRDAATVDAMLALYEGEEDDDVLRTVAATTPVSLPALLKLKERPDLPEPARKRIEEAIAYERQLEWWVEK
ncbi:hypothetical protein [Luteolibacter luteus]|uniref:Uncharacterized protein n=1 Tax=Luteolibacter luteus TaxID=2728835 RepID=A0A858RQ11_9BACT|nr:hypothetical protein [Luteolibacter luteus]QJE99117.1 hypothetical protein HHL09_26170 [Luteolibacter luteus]